MQIYLFVLLNDLPNCAAASPVCCAVPRNHHSLATPVLGAISTAQKANMCADALVVLPVIIVIKIQPLGAVSFIALLHGTALSCYSAIITIVIYKFKIYLKLKSADKHIY